MLEDKVVLITGGAKGIGKAIATMALRYKAKVAISDIDEQGVKNTAAELAKELNGECLGIYANVAEFTDCQKMIDEVLKQFGKLDVLVNNAGITRDQLLLKMTDEDWEQVISVNLKGAFNCCRAAVRQFLKQRSGRIINISSVVGLMGNPGQANYSASKAGLIGLTKTLAKELASRNITVNAVAPGFIKTSMTEAIPEPMKQELITRIPLSRFGEPQDVANVVLFLASELASYITGEVIKVDGGMVM